MPAIGIDFDGVLHDHSAGWADGAIIGPALPGAARALRAFLDAGMAVFVHTARSPWKVAEWIASTLEVPTTTANPDPERWTTQGTVLVTQRKYPAVAYVDDRAVPFAGDWEQVYAHALIAPHLRPRPS